MATKLLVRFYCLWHGRLKLKGAGLLIHLVAPYSRLLQSFPLELPEGQTIRLDFRDISAWYWLNYTLGDRFEEAGLVEAVCKISKPGDVIWDIGANCGLFSYLLARRLPECRIFFFEPNPLVYGIASAALQPFGNVNGKNIGLSSTPCKGALLTIPAGGSTVGTLDPESLGRVGSSVSIDLETGDGLVKSGQLPAPRIIKIDTEGHESNVLAGLEQTILAAKPAIFLEHLSMSDETATSLIPAGYKLLSVSDHSGKIMSSFDRSSGHNSALLPE